MSAGDMLPDTALLTTIMSLQEKMKGICDLIPISSWGFTGDVHEKLRQRKHRMVNQQLTAKEKKTLTKNNKQQVARFGGGVCYRVSEVINLQSAIIGKDSKLEKATPTPAPSTSEITESRKENKNQKENVQMRPKSGSKIIEKTARNENSVAAMESMAKERVSTDDDSTDEEVENVSAVKSKKRPTIQSTPLPSAKKQKLSVEPMPCEAKDQTLNITEQREEAIRKLQEKLKSMKEARQGRKKGSDPSSALGFEQKRKLKRRVSKMKSKQRRSLQKQSETDGIADVPQPTVKADEEDSAVLFSKFDFLVKNEKKKKRLTTAEKKQKFTGKDYKSLINKVEKREEKFEKLKEKEPDKVADLERDVKWKRALNRAQGVKVKDNMELLRKGLVRKEKMKEKRKENWSSRETNVERGKAERQEKRKSNLQKRIDEKKKRKLQLMKKKGRVL